MSFADWKKRSKRYAEMMKRQAYYRRDVDECCQAAYKAGERQGRKDAEAVAKQAIEFSTLIKDEIKQNKWQSNVKVYTCPACGREYSGRLRCPRCGRPRV